MSSSRIIKKVKSQHIKNCPICRFAKSKRIYSELIHIRICDDIVKFKRTISICNRCGIIYMSDILTNDLMNKIYESGIINNSITYTENINQERFKFINDNIKKDKKLKICDVGCNTGEFLSHFNKEEWDRYGVEISKVASEICKERLNINIENKDWNKTSYNNKFDVITIVHMLEHSYTPMKTLQKCYSALRNSGTLYVEVPISDDINYQSINSYNPTHVICFSIDSLVMLLNKSGFYIKRIDIKKSENYMATVKVLATKETPSEFLVSEKKNVIDFKNKMVILISDMLMRWTKQNKRICIYGAGFNAIELISNIKEEDWDKIKVNLFLDKDKKKVGNSIFNIPIKAIDNENTFDCCIILSKKELESIMKKHVKKQYPNAEIFCPFRELNE